MRKLLLGVLLCLVSRNLLADEQFVPLEVKNPSTEITTSFISLLNEPSSSSNYEKSRSLLCRDTTLTEAARLGFLHGAIASVSSDISADLVFKRSSGKKEFPFFIHIEFKPESVFVKSSAPQSAQDEGGLNIPLPSGRQRSIYVAGRDFAGFLLELPDVKGCESQGVLICPRKYVPRARLAVSDYVLKGVRYQVSGKADGVFPGTKDSDASAKATIRTSAGITPPKSWFAENKGRSATIKLSYDSPIDEKLDKVQTELVGGVESRLEFQRSDLDSFSVFSRALIAIDEFTVQKDKTIEIDQGKISLEAGSCYLVSRWSERSDYSK